MKGFVRVVKFLFAASLIVAVVMLGYLLFQERVDYENDPAEELSIGGVTKYYFNRLSNLEKHAYNNILSGIDERPWRIEVPTMTQSELGKIFEALLYDNPAFYFTGRECTVGLSDRNAFFYPQYEIDEATYSAQMTAVENASQAFLSTVGGVTDEYALELAVHDYLVKTCSYGESNATIYDALVTGSASCEGYSKAAKYLLDKLGIPCYVMCGVSENYKGETEDHMWNVVKIGGGWYNLDVTWDDPADADDDGIRHTYFNISDAEISASHSHFKNDNPCVSTQMGYYQKSGLMFSAYDDAAQDSIVKLIAEAADNGAAFVEFKFASDKDYKAADKALFDRKGVYRLQERAAAVCSARLVTGSTHYTSDERFNIIQLYIPYA